jgi:hypothetical protein
MPAWLLCLFLAACGAESSDKSSSPTSNLKAIEAAVVDSLTDAERARAVVYFDVTLIPAGTVGIGGRQVEIDHPFVTAFIDKEPGTSWMHPCRYLLIDPVTRQINAFDSDRPPVFGMLPSSWRVMRRSPDLADSQLIPIAPAGHP